MKYIRTKDGIFEYIELEDKLFIKRNNLVAPILNKNNLEKDIINQADTIEELCDEFVIEKKEPFIGKLEDLPRLADILKIHNKNSKNKWNLYGAIWTEWGLKYVAKMNENGELELL